jgi:hypothetical protein
MIFRKSSDFSGIVSEGSERVNSGAQTLGRPPRNQEGVAWPTWARWTSPQGPKLASPRETRIKGGNCGRGGLFSPFLFCQPKDLEEGPRQPPTPI